MRIACLVIVHKYPQQIERLIRKFNHPAFDFYLHLSKKIPITDFEYLKDLKNVFFIRNRVRVRWGSYSIVEGILSSMQEILAGSKPYDFISVMSGQDYPIKPVSTIYAHLENNKDKNFICFEEGDSWWRHAITRINKYHFSNFDFRGRYRLQSLVNTVLPARRFPLPYNLYGNCGAAWMTLQIDCVKYLVNFIAENKRLKRFANFTWAPDEFLLPTIIMNSKFRDTVINDNFYHIDWPPGCSNPKIFTAADFATLANSDKMLARKFDIFEDETILDMLDTEFD